MFIAALLKITKKEKQLKCSLTNEKINKTHSMKYSSAIKRNDVFIYAR